jgi:hypothetical protein
VRFLRRLCSILLGLQLSALVLLSRACGTLVSDVSSPYRAARKWNRPQQPDRGERSPCARSLGSCFALAVDIYGHSIVRPPGCLNCSRGEGRHHVDHRGHEEDCRRGWMLAPPRRGQHVVRVVRLNSWNVIVVDWGRENLIRRLDCSP